MLALRFKTIVTRARRTLPFATQNVRLTAILMIILLFLYPIPSSAAESSPSADIKIKLEELKKEIASKAAKLKQDVGRKLKNKAYVGMVKAKSETSLTLAAASGPKMVSINQDTVYESKVKGQAKFSQKSLTEDDYISALGDMDETAVLIAKKIILLPAPPASQRGEPAGGPTVNSQPKTYLWGQIISISDKLITLKDRDFKIVAVSLPTESKVKLNDFVILTGSKDKNDIFKAGFSFVIPQGGIIKPKKVVYPAPNGAGATPSAQVATPSAKPKVSR